MTKKSAVNTERERERFELWWERYNEQPIRGGWQIYRCEGGGYNDEDLDAQWEAWQARAMEGE